MTISFGKTTDAVIQEYLSTNRGKSVILVATELGISDDAIAVRINSDVPTTNAIPHITIAIPPGGKPVNSNKITEWAKLDHPIELTATINAFYG